MPREESDEEEALHADMDPADGSPASEASHSQSEPEKEDKRPEAQEAGQTFPRKAVTQAATQQRRRRYLYSGIIDGLPKLNGSNSIPLI